MAQVRWSLTAGTDLQEIEDFIARDSVLHAITFVDYIVESAETFLKTPLIGRVVPEFNRQDLREVIFRGYRIVYLVQNDEVLILRVVHGARDLLGLIRREPWDLGG
ncbi:MAG: type II toxin-antitoxin system RelE/ParE family toxin [Nitrospira sp.]|nr:type II toxin-antitoxin system RelE/ParE family toxin [Nitrospira sp.]